MNWLEETLLIPSAIQAVIIICLICALGLSLGKLRIRGVSLGVTYVFFIGILAGALGLQLDSRMLGYAESFGLILFVYILGLQVGPGFMSTFRRGGTAMNLLAFGVMGLMMIYVVDPWLFRLFGHLSSLAAKVLGSVLMALMLADVTISSTILAKIRHTAEITGGDDTETITHHVRAVLMEKGMLFRRALRAFPEARLYSGEAIRRLRQARKELEQDLRGKRDAFRSDLDKVEEKLREDWRQRRENTSAKKDGK